MLSIQINCEPYDIENHLKALGFMRRPVTGAEDQPRVEAPRIIGKSPELVAPYDSKTTVVTYDSVGAPRIDMAPVVSPPPANPLADELTALERPEDLKAPEAPAGATRVRGQPAPGRKRRTKEEIAEDMAYLQTPEGAKAAADAPASISTGEVRLNPEDEAADAADEAAESAQRADGPPTMDDLRAAVKRYSDKFGPEVAIVNVRKILGRSMLETLPDEIGNAIAKMDLATAGATVLGVAQPSSSETSVMPPASLFDDGPAAAVVRTATRQDVIAAMTSYCVKFDGTNDPNKAPNGHADLPRIMKKACGAVRISLLPQTPEGFGAAVVAIEEATKNNPFGRPVRA